MQISSADAIKGTFRWLKKPSVDGPPAQRDPAVVERVSAMLTDIESNGLDSVRRYARDLDGWQADEFEIGRRELERTGERLPDDVRVALELGHERTSGFARVQREHLTDFETELAPGLVCGQRYVPVGRVGAYLPAGRFPLLASAFMTVGVAKAADVPQVVACTPPTGQHGADPAVLYAAYLSGADRVFALGGVQALAAMAFGLLGDQPVDMLVGAGNAFVTEAKRQLFGRVGIDLLAGPSEVAVIADDTADAQLVAADLLGQAEHGPNSPSALVTTSEALGNAVIAEVDHQLSVLPTREIAAPAWRDYGQVLLADDGATAVELSDHLGPEHLEIHTSDDDFYHDELRNYGSLFLGKWSTVAYSDKGISGTNHVLPTGGTARYNAGLSVARYLKALTYQRATRDATPHLAPAVERVSAFEGLAAHGTTATMRRTRFSDGSVSDPAPRRSGRAEQST